MPLIEAELHVFTAEDWRNLTDKGLEVIDLDARQVERAFQLKAAHAALSPYDCFSLTLAEENERSILLTGDRQLRQCAGSKGIEVHGVLWVADQIVRTETMPILDLLDALERWSADPLVFLPKKELLASIERLRKSLHQQASSQPASLR